MEAALAWIGYIVEWLGLFIPRLVIVRSTHAGVRFRYGKQATAIKPGLCVYWPIVTEVEVIAVARQTLNLPSQSLTTKDGHRVVVGGMVVYSITDVVASMAKAWDVADAIKDVSMSAITKVITKMEYADILGDITGDVQAAITKETRRTLKSFGVRVYRTAITDFSKAIVLKNIGDRLI